ncbi:hypothetical protein C2845_PM05G24580 [Panicum miliaceum]|uniref:Uncharacterized protein n=1 Tax=Panicum miliaceum TaxID=4540 RepID=A0A3L6T577_PANMI|nr:hypothetical protein C2845_PM05G24580 [Panicum miliaceum]
MPKQHERRTKRCFDTPQDDPDEGGSSHAYVDSGRTLRPRGQKRAATDDMKALVALVTQAMMRLTMKPSELSTGMERVRCNRTVMMKKMLLLIIVIMMMKMMATRTRMQMMLRHLSSTGHDILLVEDRQIILGMA